MTTFPVPALLMTIFVFMTVLSSTVASSSLWRLFQRGARGKSMDSQYKNSQMIQQQQKQGDLPFCSDTDVNILGFHNHFHKQNHNQGHDPTGHRVSWQEDPPKGSCYDSKLGYTFDCHLIKILEEGLVLIEDLRAGGVFAAQPKSQYSTRAARRHDNPILTPHVMMDHHDPREDFRTNVQMNLEGF